MAFVLTTKQVKGSGFCAQLTGDISGTETAVAAVASKSHYITSITIFTATVNTFTVQDNTDVTPVVIFGPFTTAATYTGGAYRITFDKPIMVAAGKQIDVTASAADTFCLVIQGTTE